MRSLRATCLALAAFLVLVVPMVGLAGPFSVAPLRLDFAPGQNNAEFRIENQGDTMLDVQLRVMAWSQDDAGNDVLDNAPEMVLFPRLARIPAGETQVVRVVHRIRETPARELAFRLFAEELPIAAEAGAPVKFQLQVSVPVFVHARRQSSRLELLGAAALEGLVRVRVHNGGNAHDRANKVLVHGLDASGQEVFNAEAAGWYVLPGITTAFEVALPAGECRLATRLRVTVEAESVPLSDEIDLDPAACPRDEEERS